MKPVFASLDSLAVMTVCELLEKAGIITAAHGEGAYIAVLRDEDEPAAKAIVQRFELGELRPGPALAAEWTCPNCGEVVEGQFSDCWKCSTSRPAA